MSRNVSAQKSASFLAKNERREGFHHGVLLCQVRSDYILQHFSQPALSPQHAAHLAGSLQQLPLHFVAAMLLLPLWVAHPVVIIRLVANSAAIIIIVFILVGPLTLWLVRFTDDIHAFTGNSIPARRGTDRRNITPIGWAATASRHICGLFQASHPP